MISRVEISKLNYLYIGGNERSGKIEPDQMGKRKIKKK